LELPFSAAIKSAILLLWPEELFFTAFPEFLRRPNYELLIFDFNCSKLIDIFFSGYGSVFSSFCYFSIYGSVYSYTTYIVGIYYATSYVSSF